MDTHPECPLCPENGKVNIIAETAIAYLVEAKNSPVENSYLIVPKDHITDITLMLGRWQSSFRLLLVKVPWYTPETPYNVSLNSGRAAGQTLTHLHYWVIPRTEDEASASYGKGTATLIKELNHQAAPVT